jgi:hypothetical protein
MKPWFKAGLIIAGLIVLLSTFFVGQQVEKLVVQHDSLNVDTLYIVSVLMGSALIAVGLRIKVNKRTDSKNSAR